MICKTIVGCCKIIKNPALFEWGFFLYFWKMKRLQNLLIYFLLLLPFISFCQTNSDCSDVTISSATINGNYAVNSYLESDGIRDGNDYYGSTIYYPENTSGLLPSITIIPGYANPELSIQAWGSFSFSWYCVYDYWY